MELLSSSLKNAVLASVQTLIDTDRSEIIRANQQDLDAWQGTDQAMYDRLVINDKKVDGMLKAIQDVIDDEDPVGRDRYSYNHPNGMKVVDRTAPFGTILIIYESRPDVTIEAAIVAFKSNNKILLKGGKEAKISNRALIACWHQALKSHGLSEDWIQLLEYNREETQSFLKAPHLPLDLIVPRGGEGLINFVKQHATCPVLISGRGNNFMYIDETADWAKVIPIVLNAKTDKISACNALDKILINKNIDDVKEKLESLIAILADNGVEVLTKDLDSQWPEEYLAMKIAIGYVDDMQTAISLMNQYSGGHSASIITEKDDQALQFMNEVDAAAVYHNASTRFTDGGQMGLGAELAISTDKLHHRGPLGLAHLVTNKWYVFGDGQVR